MTPAWPTAITTWPACTRRSASRSMRFDISASIAASWALRTIDPPLTPHGDLGWHLRLQLSRVERQLLSREPAHCSHAGLLCGALRLGRDQLHLLSNAE